MSEHPEPDGAKPAEEPAGSLMRCIECDIVSRDTGKWSSITVTLYTSGL
jgi:hypothetical protein